MDRGEWQTKPALEPARGGEEQAPAPSSPGALRARPPKNGILPLFLAAAVIIVIAALLAELGGSGNDTRAGDGRRSVSAFAASTAAANAAQPREAEVLPAGERIEPSAKVWEVLLPQLEQQAKANPDNRNSQRKLALGYYDLGRFEEALTIYEGLLESREEAVLRNRLGNTLRDMGDTDGAAQAYRRAIADDPTLAAPYLNLAELLWREAKNLEALATIDQGLQAVSEEDRTPLQTGRDFLEGVQQPTGP